MPNEFDPELLKEMHKRRDERRLRALLDEKRKALKAHLAKHNIRSVESDPSLVRKKDIPSD